MLRNTKEATLKNREESRLAVYKTALGIINIDLITTNSSNWYLIARNSSKEIHILSSYYTVT